MRRCLLLLALAAAASSAHAAIPASQRQALVAIYNGTGGAQWKNRDGWLGAEGTECKWSGIGCDGQEANVVSVLLESNNLRGAIPADVAKLTELEYFNVQGNQLTGTIPREIGSLSKLQILHVDDNQLGGPLPAELGNLSQVRELTASYNAIDGPIPPELGRLKELFYLELSVNALSGPIPKELASAPKLEHLGLVVNKLTGTIPKELGDLSTLLILRLGANQLEGSIPPELGKLHDLQELDLGHNRLTGVPPDALGELGALTFLALDDNELEGPIPQSLLRLANLQELYLGVNRFQGEIPRAIGTLSNLEVLSLYANRFTGTIPSEIGTMKKLRLLGLQLNSLTGTIPPILGDLQNLTVLDLSGNQLTGTIPPSLGKLASLDYLSLSENQLEGPIPPELGSLGKLTTLYLATNRLSGPIPDALRNLKGLQHLNAAANALSGPLPSWIGELTQLTDLVLGYNQLSGSIPASIGSLTALTYLDFSVNQIEGSIPREIGNLKELQFLGLLFNELTGSIPDTLGNLTQLEALNLDHNRIGGPLPRSIGNLTKLTYLTLEVNELEGPIPPEIGNLTNLAHLTIYGNRFSGTVPRELGSLTKLTQLDFSYNALRGPLPAELQKLTALAEGENDFGFNALFTSDAALRDFLNRKQYDHQWEASQTVTPAGLRVRETSDRSATLEWTTIPYTYDGGGYQIVASTVPGGPPAALATTSSKELDSIIVRNLSPSTTYFFTVATVTHPHDIQESLLVSDPSAPVTASTGPRVVAPPDVDVIETTHGLVQVDGVPRNEDSFTLTNFGDASTTITIQAGEGQGDFFKVAPETFPLAGGASQTVKVTSLAKPVGTYYGYTLVTGAGTGENGIVIGVVLLSTVRPAGTVQAQAVSTRIEVAGAPGSDSLGVARFRNAGTAALSGIVVSDQPWVEPSRDPVTIDPGSTGSANFRVVRSKRPAGEGALTATLSLVYVDGSADTAKEIFDTPATAVSVTRVTVVDVTKPPVAPGSIPGAPPGQIALFAPGIASFQRDGSSFASDVSILNAGTARSVNDLKLYFTPAGSSSTSVASMASLPSSQSVSLVNVVTNVYGAAEATGTLQLRSMEWDSLAVLARLTKQGAAGTYSGDVPVFRADRSIAAGEQLYLAGVRSPGDLFVQETAGQAAAVRISFLDASGNAIGAARSESVAGFGLLSLTDAVPSSAAVAVVENLAGSAGRIAAYARITDSSTGDTWSIVDWSHYFRYALDQPVRIPLVEGGTSSTGTPPARRRPTIRPTAVTPRSATDVVLFNPTTADARARVSVVDASGSLSEREVTIGPRRTVTLSDVGAGTSSATAHVVLDPLRGSIVASARESRAGAGMSVPVLAAVAGLRVGQSRSFAGLDDSTSATVGAVTPATFRTSYGLVETSGAPVRVRVRLFIDEGHTVTATVEQSFDLSPRQQLFFPELVRSFAGNARDSAYGDLHGLQMQIEVVSGAGSVVPFLVMTDNGSGDSLLRLE